MTSLAKDNVFAAASVYFVVTEAAINERSSRASIDGIVTATAINFHRHGYASQVYDVVSFSTIDNNSIAGVILSRSLTHSKSPDIDISGISGSKDIFSNIVCVPIKTST